MLREEILRQGSETVLAFIMAPIGGASTAALVAPDSCYDRIRQICDEFNILLIANGQPHSVEVVINAIWTMQRQADCLGMDPMAFDGERVRIKQLKTGATVWVRPAPQLLPILQWAKDRKQIRVHLNSRA